MEKIGIVCEYNPFHNGHIYHINKIKKMYPDSIICLILNGFFLQRGEVSILTKYDKTDIALKSNVDLVIEMPALYGTQSADNFAYYAIYILNKLGIDKIVFGSETNDIEKIKNIAAETEKDEYKQEIKTLLDDGVNYPTALAKSLNTKFTFLPNDLLGISYVKAINKINNNITPLTIQRTNSYLDTNSSDRIVSASNIRTKINNNVSIDRYLPKYVIKKIKKVNYNKLYDLLRTIIIRDTHLNEILDVDEGIESRLKAGIKKCNDYSSFIEYIKTKRYTYNKINRMLIHILLGIKKEDANSPITYLKVLGLNNIGRDYLKSIKKDLDISVNIDADSKIFQYELNAAYVYDILCGTNTYHTDLVNKPLLHKEK